MNEKTVWESYTEEDKKKVYDFCEEYRTFLSKCKTERECVKEILKEAEAKGYRSLKEVRRSGEKLQAGDKVYVSIMGKTLALFHIGKEPMEKGMNILGAHIDSPRLDLKQNPLYESDGLAMLETHYYGGIKKYQWVAMPLALHGVVAKKDGTSVEIALGEDPSDPVIGISDLLPHLGKKQMEKRGNEVVEGEDLNILVGSIPLSGEEKEPVARIDYAREAKSVGNGMTFCHDLTTADEMHTAIRMLSDTVATRLRRHGQFCRTVQLTVKTPDLRAANRQTSLSAPTAVAKEIADEAIALLHKWYPVLPAVRMFTVTAANLTDDEAGEQLDLFSERDTAAHDRQVRLGSAVDRIRGKYGGTAIGIGSLLQNDFVADGKPTPPPKKAKE